MEELVAGVFYDFALTTHAKIQLAFRHRIAHEAEELRASYDGKHKRWTPDRPLFKLTLESGKRLPVILRGNTVVTVYPSSAVMQSSIASEFCHCIGTALTVSPELYSLDEVVGWSQRFEGEQGNLRVHHLQRDIRIRAQSWSEDTNNLVKVLAEANARVEQLENEIVALQAANLTLISLPANQPATYLAGTSDEAVIADTAVSAAEGSTGEILFGINGAGDLVAHNASNHPIYRFSDCEVIQINEADALSNEAHELVFIQNGRQRVLSTFFPKYLREYQVGDTEIFTAFVNGRHHVNGRPFTLQPANDIGQIFDPSRFLREKKLLTLKAFNLGRSMSNSHTLPEAIRLIHKKVGALEGQDNVDDRLEVFYLLILAESIRGKDGDIIARQKAQSADQRSKLGMYEMYMEIVEETLEKLSVDQMTGRLVSGNSIQTRKAAPIRDENGDVEDRACQMIDTALDTLGFSDSDLTESELNFIYRWRLTDLLESDDFIEKW